MSRLSLSLRTLWNSQTYSFLRGLIRREQPHIMHCTNTFPLISPAAYYAAQKEGTAVVQSLRNYRLLCPNTYFLWENKVCEDCLGRIFAWSSVIRRCYRGNREASTVTAAMNTLHRILNTWGSKVNMYFTPTEFARQKFIDGGLPSDKMAIKPNFIHPDPGPGPGGHYAIFVGRLSKEKGIETMLKAWARMPDNVPLKIIGDGPLREEVKSAAQRNSNIQWLGRKSPEDTLSTLGNASFLIMPSICYETFGRTIIEAFAKGTPVIASRIGALAELVDNNRTGLHFEPGNPEELMRKVYQFVGNMPGQARMRLAARKEYLKKYTANKNYDILMSIYASAISKHRRAQKPGLIPPPIPPGETVDYH